MPPPEREWCNPLPLSLRAPRLHGLHLSIVGDVFVPELPYSPVLSTLLSIPLAFFCTPPLSRALCPTPGAYSPSRRVLAFYEPTPAHEIWLRTQRAPLVHITRSVLETFYLIGNGAYME